MDAEAVARAFGLAGPARFAPGPAARGVTGQVRRLEAAGTSWAVKTALDDAAGDHETTTAFQEAAIRDGVPAPRPRRTPEGAAAAVVDGVQVRLQQWVDLGARDPHLEPRLVGATLAALHLAAPHRAGPPGREPVDPWYTTGLGAPGWDGLIDRLAAAGAPFAALLVGQRDELVALEAWLEPPGPLRMCHRDLWADNLLPDLGPGGNGACVIDWDEAGPADPAHELGMVLFEFARDAPERARALFAAYREAGGPARLDRPGQFSMLIAVLAHITEAAGEDWLGASTDADRAVADAWIHEALDDPLTRDRLFVVLQSVSSG